MNMDLANVDVHLASHWRRVERAERFGPLLSASRASASTHRILPVVVTAAGTLLRVIGVAVRSVGALSHDSRESLRSKDHDLAALGITWTTDAAYDQTLAAEARYAQHRRLAAHAITPPAAIHTAVSHGTAILEPQRSNSEAFVRISGRRRISMHPAAVGAAGQAGD